MYVYLRSESGLWSVGFYDPNGEWFPESDYNSPKEAAARVHYLNGGLRLDDINTVSYVVISVDEGIIQNVLVGKDYDSATAEAVSFAAECIKNQKESDSYAQVWKVFSDQTILLETFPVRFYK